MKEDFIKKQLIKHLQGGEAFMPVSKMLEEVTFEQVGKRPEGLPYSFYEIFYHITYAQEDILNFCVSENYKNPNWPNDYWPQNQQPKSKSDWEELQKKYNENLNSLISFLQYETSVLDKPVKNGKENHTLIRELLLVIEHTAYHTGQLLIVLRLLNLH